MSNHNVEHTTHVTPEYRDFWTETIGDYFERQNAALERIATALEALSCDRINFDFPSTTIDD